MFDISRKRKKEEKKKEKTEMVVPHLFDVKSEGEEKRVLIVYICVR